jgi:rare lipoprotein A (peptidoglycan hydrolase)
LQTRREDLLRILISAVATVASFTASSASAPSGCAKLFTVAQTEKLIARDFAGARRVTESETAAYRHEIRCQRFAYNRPKVRRYLAATVKAWRVRRYNAANPLQYAVASWYDDAGNTACGFHAYYGVASPDVAFIGPQLFCGRHVEFHYGGRVVVATIDDAGPFIAGRRWDLNQNTAAALGFSGVATVGYRDVR